jgi:hypothetical protein
VLVHAEQPHAEAARVAVLVKWIEADRQLTGSERRVRDGL